MGTTNETIENPNRKERRYHASMMRRFVGIRLKKRAEEALAKVKLMKAVSREAHLSIVRKRTAERVALRKKIAATEGVNWRRVVLTSRVDATEPTYVIKDSYGKGKGSRRPLAAY
jgi:hypothetical protein